MRYELALDTGLSPLNLPLFFNFRPVFEKMQVKGKQCTSGSYKGNAPIMSHDQQLPPHGSVYIVTYYSICWSGSS